MRGCILLCSEAGTGRGHGVRLREIGLRLERQGYRTVYAVRPSGGSAALLRQHGVELVDAPQWPRSDTPKLASSVTLADMLWDEGLSSPAGLQDQISRWHLIFSEFAPRLVVADFAPGATLATRGRFPTLITGNGFTVPPTEIERFPELHRLSPPRVDQDGLCTAINEVLAAQGAPALEALPRLFEGEATCPITFDELDPYRTHRRTPVLCPEVRLDALTGENDTLFAYFWQGGQHGDMRTFCDALCKLTMQRLVYAPGIAADDAALLTRSGCSLLTEPKPVSEIAALARLVIHRGGLGLTTMMMVAGVPQVILATDIEKTLIGKGAQNCGGAVFLQLWESDSETVASTIEAAWNDETLRCAARDNAPDFANRADSKTFDHIAGLAIGLIS